MPDSSPEYAVNMTSKGQVLIPKDVREGSGLVPGSRVRISRNERGEVVLRSERTPAAETREAHAARLRTALTAVAGKYPIGSSTDDYMRDLRGDWEP